MGLGTFDVNELHTSMQNQIVEWCYKKYGELISDVPMMADEMYTKFELAENYANLMTPIGYRKHQPRWILLFFFKWFVERSIPESANIVITEFDKLYAGV